MLMDWAKKSNVKAERVNYTAEFVVDSNFGVPGAITVLNKHQKEFFMESITIEGFACAPLHFPCNSWVQSTNHFSGKRIFFSNQVLLLFYFFFLIYIYQLLISITTNYYDDLFKQCRSNFIIFYYFFLYNL